MFYIYMNVDTGEVFTLSKAVEQWKIEYDGNDDTNVLTFENQYKPYKVSYEMFKDLRNIELNKEV